MWFAFIIIAVLIFYGSVFPFHFHALSIDGNLIATFFESWRIHSSLTDIFGNVALFAPLSATGMLAFPKLSYWNRIALVSLSGLALALVSQLAQYYVPARIPALEDVLWNAIGIAIGLGLGALALRLLRRGGNQEENSVVDPIPLLLIGLWFAVRLFPFLPSNELRVYRDSLKPLLEDPVLSVAELFIGIAGWLAAALLMKDLGIYRRIAPILLALGSVTFALEVIIVGNSVSFSDVAALLASLLIILTILRWLPNPAAFVSVIIVVALVYAGLEPFQQSGRIGHFNWVPFSSTINGYLFFNMKVMIAKLFFYSALVWFLDRMRSSSLFAVAGATSIVAGIEVAQLFLTSHSAEITDPVLVLVCAAIIYAGKIGRAHV